jgi:2,3-bisphosphoglycerate-dependent phosphoglycerate mutase
MASRLLFVRHAESVCGVTGVFGGQRGCQGLTGAGREQAESLARRLTAEVGTANDVVVYSSALRRATETAAPIAAAVGTSVREDCRLCTWHVPDYADGQPKAVIQAKHALSGGGTYRPFEEGSETWAELVARAGQAITEIGARHRDATVIVVGHTETTEVSFHALGLLPLYRGFDLAVGYGSVTEWTTTEDPAAWPPPRWTLVRFNDN